MKPRMKPRLMFAHEAPSDRDYYDQFEYEDSPYCECGLDPTEDEQMDNVCDACGKRLEP